MKIRTITWLSILVILVTVILAPSTNKVFAANAEAKANQRGDDLSVSFLVDGEYGGGGWFRSYARAYPSIYGSSAQDAIVYLSVNGEKPKRAREYLVQSGSVELTWTVVIHGRQTDTFTHRINVDAHPPATYWELRPFNGRSRPIRPIDIEPVQMSGAVQMSGVSYDSMSGVRHAEISIDAGRTWIIIPLPNVEMKHRAELKWTVVVDTTLLPNGPHTLLARTVDRAGNVGETMTLDVVVDN